MIDNNTVTIYYQAGAYGTFIEWCLNYFTNELFSDELPFSQNGSAHKFMGTPVFSQKMYKELLQSTVAHNFARFHPGCISDENFKLLNSADSGPYFCYQNDIEYLSSFTKKTIVLYYNMDSILWGWSNLVTKTSAMSMNDLTTTQKLLEFRQHNDIREYLHRHTSFKDVLFEQANSLNARGWNAESIKQMSDWELREFLSLYLHGSWVNTNGQDVFDKLQKKFPLCIFVEIKELRDNFEMTIKSLIASTGIRMIRNDKISYVYDNWLKLQTYAYRDQLISKVVDHTIKNLNFDWSSHQLSIYDEAMIQKQLRDNGYEIKCFNLNKFPTCATDLYKLIYAT